MTVVAVVFLSDLVVVALVSPTLGRLPFFARAFLEAMVVAACASPFLCRFVIEPFREAVARVAKKSSTVLDAAPEGIFEVAPDGRIQSMNAEATRLFGYTREELIGKEIEILIPQRFREAHVQKREGYLTAPRTRPMGSGLELVGRKKSGEEFPVGVSLSTIQEQEGPLVICVVKDISIPQAAKNEIVQINERLTQSLAARQALSETLARLSDFGELLQSCTTRPEAYPIVAKMCARLFPGQSGAVYLATASKTALERVTAWGQVHPPKPIVALHECWALRRGKMHTSEMVACDGCQANSGRPQQAETMCVPMIAQGDMIGVLHLSTPRASADLPAKNPVPSAGPETGVLTAVAERISVAIANLRLREELRDQAIRDTMTGLLNRRFLEEYLELELLQAMRNDRPLTVMMLDVDHFKRFNDAFGHRAGDLVLREVAGILRTHTRGSDIACRYGGEELVVVSPEASPGQAVARAEQIRHAIENLTVIDEGRPLGKITISIGVASAPEQGYDMTELLHAADEALYAAKNAGRNRVCRAASQDLIPHNKAERAAASDIEAALHAVEVAVQEDATISTGRSRHL